MRNIAFDFQPSTALCDQSDVLRLPSCSKRAGIRSILAWLATTSAALLLAAPVAVADGVEPDGCAILETTVTCSGDLSGGIVVDADEITPLYDELILEEIDVGPNEEDGFIQAEDGDFAGIYVTNVESFKLQNSVDDVFTIHTTGDDVYGIYIVSVGEGVVTIDTNGRIETEGEESHGILVESDNASVNITHNGDIETSGANTYGIYADNTLSQENAENGGGIQINHEGSITNHGEGNDAVGIFVVAKDFGDVSVVQRGDIEFTGGDSSRAGVGIEVLVGTDLNEQSGNAEIEFYGDFMASNGAQAQAVYAVVDFGQTGDTAADVNVTFVGDIGIFNVLSWTEMGYGDAIYAEVNQGKATVNYSGTLRAHIAENAVKVVVRGLGGSAEINLGKDNGNYDGRRVEETVIVSDTNAVYVVSPSNSANQINLYNEVILLGTNTDISVNGSGNDTINNYGTFTSTNYIFLGDGANFFNNHAGGKFYSSSEIQLGEDFLTDDSIKVLVDGEGKMVRTYFDGETVPDGLTIAERRGNTFYNAGFYSPGGVREEPFSLPDDEDTDADESFPETLVTTGIGETSLTGNFIQSETGIFAVNIDTDTGASDKLIVDATDALAELGGRLLVIPNAEVDSDENRYVFLENYDGEISGRFIIPYISAYEADYDTDGEVALVFRGQRTLCGAATSQNERAVACQDLSRMSENSGIRLAFESMVTAEELQDAYRALSGDIHASLSGVLMESSTLRSDAVLARLNAFTAARVDRNRFALSHDASLFKDQLSQLNWWIKGQGGMVSHDADSGLGTDGLEHVASGMVIGADYSNEDFTIGAMFAIGQGTTEYDQQPAEDDVRTSSMGVYGSTPLATSYLPMNLHFGVFGNYHEIETKRTVAFENFYEWLGADYHASSVQAFAELSTEVTLDGGLSSGETKVQPFISLSHITLETDEYAEAAVGRGSSSAALLVVESSHSLTSSKLGLRASSALSSRGEGAAIKLFGEIGWRFNLGDVEPESQVSFIDGNQITIAGSPVAGNTLSAQLGVSIQLGRKLHLTAAYRGEIGENSEAHNVSGGLLGRF